MNKKIFFSSLSILSALAMIGGATFAYFTSNATSTGNVFAAGNLNLLVDDNNEATPATTVTASFGDGTTPLMPGATQSGFLSLHNSGSIAINKIKLSAAKTATTDADLAAVLDITSAKVGDDSSCTTGVIDIAADMATQLGSPLTLAKLNGHTFKALPGLGVGATKYLCMAFTMDSLASDTYQGASATETFSLEADQDASQ